jgi:hypothetical protein
MRLTDSLRRRHLVACTLCWIDENRHKEYFRSGPLLLLLGCNETDKHSAQASPRCLHAFCSINESGHKETILFFLPTNLFLYSVQIIANYSVLPLLVIRAMEPANCKCSNKGRNLVVCIDGTSNQFGTKVRIYTF